MSAIAIVNADDFGRSAGINRGVIQAFEHGIVTSASLMVRWSAAVDAAAYASGQPTLSLGLHLDLGEWAYEDQEWRPVYEVTDIADARAVRDEIKRQMDRFERISGHLPTHIDSHQHVHLREPVRRCVREAVLELDVPVRGLTLGIHYSGRFYGQDSCGRPCREKILVGGLLDTLARLESGATEIGCHPAASADVDSIYNSERVTELRTLCDPSVKPALAEMGVRLASFLEWRAARAA